MAAFDKVLSGIPALDKALDSIRMGDNVVWRVSVLEEFRRFAIPFVEQAKKDGRKIIYFRFAAHPELVPECPEVKRVIIPLSHRFETFTVEIHKVIEQEGRDAFYVFDCLSELQTAWATDLMMGNFFRVTCPFLFILDTVAFFPIIRGRHSFNAVNKIISTTQLFLDVYSDPDREDIYIRPQKVWNRTSDTMFLPHLYRPAQGTVVPVRDGVQTSRFYQVMDGFQRTLEEQYVDSWDRFFNQVKVLHENRIPVDEQCVRMCNIMMTRDERLRALVRKHFRPEDYFRVRDHMVGTGMVGGKTCGMLLARAIIRRGQRLLGPSGPSADGGRILLPCRGAGGTPEERLILRGYPGAVHAYPGVLRPGSLYRSLQQYPGGRFRQCLCRKVRVGVLRQPRHAGGTARRI